MSPISAALAQGERGGISLAVLALRPFRHAIESGGYIFYHHKD